MKYRMSDLQNFIETSNHPTMAQAARKLGITQPSLSESIKRLESDLSTILFYRARTGISLTITGKSALDSAKKVLSQILEVEAICSNKLLFNGRSISIGCHPVVASYTLPFALRILSNRIKDYQVKIKHGRSREIQAQIQSGQIDIGILVSPTSVPDLILKTISTDHVYVWSSGEKNNAQKLICNPDIFQTSRILKNWTNSPADIIESESLELIVRLVEQGIGFGIIPERAVKLLNSKLVKHDELPNYRDKIVLAYRPEFGKNLIEKEVIKVLTESLTR